MKKKIVIFIFFYFYIFADINLNYLYENIGNDNFIKSIISLPQELISKIKNRTIISFSYNQILFGIYNINSKIGINLHNHFFGFNYIYINNIEFSKISYNRYEIKAGYSDNFKFYLRNNLLNLFYDINYAYIKSNNNNIYKLSLFVLPIPQIRIKFNNIVYNNKYLLLKLSGSFSKEIYNNNFFTDIFSVGTGLTKYTPFEFWIATGNQFVFFKELNFNLEYNIIKFNNLYYNNIVTDFSFFINNLNVSIVYRYCFNYENEILFKIDYYFNKIKKEKDLTLREIIILVKKLAKTDKKKAIKIVEDAIKSDPKNKKLEEILTILKNAETIK